MKTVCSEIYLVQAQMVLTLLAEEKALALVVEVLFLPTTFALCILATGCVSIPLDPPVSGYQSVFARCAISASTLLDTPDLSCPLEVLLTRSMRLGFSPLLRRPPSVLDLATVVLQLLFRDYLHQNARCPRLRRHQLLPLTHHVVCTNMWSTSYWTRLEIAKA